MPAKTEDTAPEPTPEPTPAPAAGTTEPGATTAPGGAEAQAVITLASTPQDCPTDSAVDLPSDIKVGQFIGVDPGSIGGPSSHKRMPLVAED